MVPFLAAPTLLLVVAACACYLSARRETAEVDPMRVPRHEQPVWNGAHVPATPRHTVPPTGLAPLFACALWPLVVCLTNGLTDLAARRLPDQPASLFADHSDGAA